MSDYLESKPCKAQAKLMKKLGFRTLETDDAMTAAWQQGFMILHLPAGLEPRDESEIVRRVSTAAYEQGMAAARQQMRAALGIQ